MPGSGGRRRRLWRRLRFVPALGWGAAALAVWLAAAPKQDAVAGRLGYAQWLAFVAACALAATAAAVALAPEPRRRQAALRAAAAWIGTAAAVGSFEAASWLWPVAQPVDNPFYLATGTGVDPGEDLPFERPPHLHWSGLSRGDLAALNDDDDPHARTVTFSTDFEGFRNPEDLRRAQLVFLGDSHAEAGNLPVEETFVQRTGKRLGVTVRNLARAGYSPSYQLVVLRKYGLAGRPDTLVWQLTEANDLGEEVRFRRWVAAGRPRTVNWMRRDEPQRTRRLAWQERSPTYRMFRLLRTPKPWPMEARFRTGSGELETIRFLAARGSEGLALPHPGWPSLVSALREGHAILTEAGIDWLVLFIPTKLRVMGPALAADDWIRGRPAEHEVPEERTLGHQLRRLCERLGVPFVDASTALQERALARELVYQPFDTHLSSRGHEVVTELLVSALAERRR